MKKYERHEHPVTFKLEVLSDLYSSGKSIRSTARNWGISDSLLHDWMKSFPVDEFPLPLPSEIIESYKMTHQKQELSAEEILQKRIEDLTRSLEYEKMRSRAFEKMIEIAEEEEGISILKKGGAKQ